MGLVFVYLFIYGVLIVLVIIRDGFYFMIIDILLLVYFVRYLYCGSVILIIFIVLFVLIFVDKYCIFLLCEFCVQYMLQYVVEFLDINRILLWYQYVKIRGYEKLKEEIFRFILLNFYIVQNFFDWLVLNKFEVQEFLSSLDIVVESEYILWRKLVEWFGY